MEDTKVNVNNSYTDPITGKFVPGNPGGGRPKGTFSLKTRIIQQLQENPDQLQEVLNYLIKEERALLWQMIDGRPSQDVTSAGEKINPIPIFNGQSVQTDNSNTKDIQPNQEN